MRRAIIVLLVLVGLFVAADFGAAALAESAVSRQMRQQFGLADDPDVRINGFPFLTQAIAGRYSSIDVNARNITVDQLQDLSVNAQLRGVDAPLSMLLSSGPKQLTVTEAEGSVRIPAKTVEQILNRSGSLAVDDLRIDSVDAAGLKAVAEDEGGDSSLASIDPKKVARLTGTMTLPLLGKNEVTVIVLLNLEDGGKVSLEPRDVRFDGSAVPGPAKGTVSEMFRLTVDPGSLPLAVTPTELTAVDGTLQISGIARNRTLSSAAPS